MIHDRVPIVAASCLPYVCPDDCAANREKARTSLLQARRS